MHKPKAKIKPAQPSDLALNVLFAMERIAVLIPLTSTFVRFFVFRFFGNFGQAILIAEPGLLLQPLIFMYFNEGDFQRSLSTAGTPWHLDTLRRFRSMNLIESLLVTRFVWEVIVEQSLYLVAVILHLRTLRDPRRLFLILDWMLSALLDECVASFYLWLGSWAFEILPKAWAELALGYLLVRLQVFRRHGI